MGSPWESEWWGKIHPPGTAILAVPWWWPASEISRLLRDPHCIGLGGRDPSLEALCWSFSGPFSARMDQYDRMHVFNVWSDYLLKADRSRPDRDVRRKNISSHILHAHIKMNIIEIWGHLVTFSEVQWFQGKGVLRRGSSVSSLPEDWAVE